MKRKIINSPGFTIIETMLVIAIAGLITVIIFIAIPQEQSARRDSQRKAYAGQVLQALEEYYKNNGKFPGCNSVCANMSRFLSLYMPDGKDPSTGEDYRSNSFVNVSNGISTSYRASIFYDNGIPHNTKPEKGQIYIATAHWCYSTRADTGDGPPLAGSGLDNNFSVFSVVIYQEHGGYYCVDNYAKTGASL